MFYLLKILLLIKLYHKDYEFLWQADQIWSTLRHDLNHCLVLVLLQYILTIHEHWYHESMWPADNINDIPQQKLYSHLLRRQEPKRSFEWQWIKRIRLFWYLEVVAHFLYSIDQSSVYLRAFYAVLLDLNNELHCPWIDGSHKIVIPLLLYSETLWIVWRISIPLEILTACL